MSINPVKEAHSRQANYCANEHLSLPRCQLTQLEHQALSNVAIEFFLANDDEFSDSANFSYVKGYN